ncbi:hypothetical protein TNCV_1699671 [Trichonephila clavipes]|nr:hypothetical protein TNCV_1699671 [Trichonephila clavipes]
MSEFHQCCEEWKKRLQRCVASEGSYFEGDNAELNKRMSWTSIRSDLRDAGASVSSKTFRSRLAGVRLKGRILQKKAVSQFTAVQKGTTVGNGTD